MSVPSSPGRLVVHLEGNLITTLEVIQPVLGIGRTPDNGLSLPHPMVSRHHAELRLGPEGPVLTDVGSTHGTSVGNDQLLPHQPRPLSHGDVVSIGPFTLTFLSSEVPAADGDDPIESVPVPAPVSQVPTAGDAAARLETRSERIESTPVAAQMPVVRERKPRERLPMTLPMAGPSAYLNDLPVVYQENDFLGRFLKIFEAIWEPLESRQERIDLYFDPATCPASFLPWLASWLDIPWNAHWPEVRARQILAGAMETYRWRGTAYGLGRILEMHTGVFPEIREDGSQPFVFHVRISSAGRSIDQGLIEEVIQMHKPAHTGYTLEIVR